LKREDGWPIHERGVATSVPGIYFVGLPFQFAATSSLIGGVGRDARHVVDRIVLARQTREHLRALVRAAG
jgi:putative flavoprotein involved in K+ transport